MTLAYESRISSNIQIVYQIPKSQIVVMYLYRLRRYQRQYSIYKQMPEIVSDFMLLLHIYLGVIKTHFYRKTKQICNFKNTILEKIHLIQVFLMKFSSEQIKSQALELQPDLEVLLIFSGQLGLASSNGSQFSTFGFQSLCCHSRQQDNTQAGQSLWASDLLL